VFAIGDYGTASTGKTEQQAKARRPAGRHHRRGGQAMNGIHAAFTASRQGKSLN
jgi:hypothetical protein